MSTKIGTSTTSACETAAIHQACRVVSERTRWARLNQPTTTSAATATASHPAIAWKTTRMPSATAIQKAIRIRRARSQRPILLDPCSSAGPLPNDLSYSIASTVPSGGGEPGTAAAPEGGRGGAGDVEVLEEAVNDRARAGNVGPE